MLNLETAKKTAILADDIAIMGAKNFAQAIVRAATFDKGLEGLAATAGGGSAIQQAKVEVVRYAISRAQLEAISRAEIILEEISANDAKTLLRDNPTQQAFVQVVVNAHLSSTNASGTSRVALPLEEVAIKPKDAKGNGVDLAQVAVFQFLNKGSRAVRALKGLATALGTLKPKEPRAIKARPADVDLSAIGTAELESALLARKAGFSSVPEVATVATQSP
jgi:hypothetical protein